MNQALGSSADDQRPSDSTEERLPADSPWFADPQEERIWRRLQGVGPGPAGFFRDACRLMNNDYGLSSTTHLVGHLVREIESAVRDVLETVAERPRPPEGNCQKRPTHADEIRSILVALGISLNDPVAEPWLRLAEQNAKGSPARLAHRESLGLRPVDNDFLAWWGDTKSVLDIVLNRFEENYAAVLGQLDVLLRGKRPDVKTLKDHVPNNLVAHQYFFERLSDLSWLEPLNNEGMFGSPPPPERDEEGLGFRFPGWPILTYLERMATDHPSESDQVLRAVLSIPDSDNVRVHFAVIAVTLKLPANLAKLVVPAAIRWLRGPYRPISGVQYGRLVAHLASGAAADEALALAEALFAVGHTVDRRGLPGAGTSLNVWDYGQAIDQALPALVGAAPIPVLSLMCDLLEQLQQGDGAGGDSGAGSSAHLAELSIWRPAIEDHDQNQNHEDISDLLVSAARDAALMAAASDPGLVPAMVVTLEARPGKIFRRIALHLLRERAESSPEIVRERLTDHLLFNDWELGHEYYHLAREHFRDLFPENQEVMLGWIEAGPSVEEYVQGYLESQGTPPEAQNVADYCDYWRLKKLMPIAEDLPAKWKQRFGSLASRFGLPEHPDFSVYGGTWIGPTSPKTLEDIKGMSPADLAEYLQQWSPSEDWDVPTPEGLGRLITAAVSDAPSSYATDAQQFHGLEATYVRSLLEGFHQAVTAKRVFDWGPVLQLALELVYSPWQTPDRSPQLHDRDPDWSWTRKSVAALIEAGLQAGESQIPSSFRETVWTILEPISDDPDPTGDDEKDHARGGLDATTDSINTVRGRAMHAIVQYGLWVRRQAAAQAGAPEKLAGATAVPEIWPILDAHLDVDHDSSLAIRSVYGQYFPWLQLLDPQWASSRVDVIFPKDPDLAAWWTAAWNGYVLHCRPFREVLPVLRPVYAHAVNSMGAFAKTLPFGERPEERLGEHLATYAWRGEIDVDPLDPLLVEYWSRAGATLRGRVLSYIGRSLREWPPAKIDAAVEEPLKRLMILWSFAGSQTGTAPAEGQTELSAFAWWFASGHFDDDWAFEQLELALRSTSMLDPAHLIVGRLVELAAREPLRSVRALTKLVESDREGWRIGGWKDEARTVLETAMRSNDGAAQQDSLALVNKLVSKGHLEFRELVDPPPEEGKEAGLS